MLELIVTISVVVLTAVLLLPDLVETQRLRQRAGAEGLVGERGEVLEALRPRGWIRVHGERWAARVEGSEVLDAGAEIEVVAVEGLGVIVRPATAPDSPTETLGWFAQHPIRGACVLLTIGTGAVVLALFSTWFYAALLPLLAAGFTAVLILES